MSDNHETEHENGLGEDTSSDDFAPVEDAGAEESSEAVDDLFLSPDDSDSELVEFAGGGDTEAEDVEIEEARADESTDGVPEAEPDPTPVPEAAAPAVSSEELDELQGKLEAAEKERDEVKERMIRTAADLENFRKRNAREKEEMRRYGIDRVVLELLPVLDNLERALEHAEKSENETQIVTGVQMVQKQFVMALKKHGVEGFDSKGEMFDPQRHEAIQQVETADHETGTVLEEYQRGYMLHDRLIRPAMVVVARKLETAEDDAAADEAVEPAEAENEVAETENDATVDAADPGADGAAESPDDGAAEAPSQDEDGQEDPVVVTTDEGADDSDAEESAVN